MSKDKFDEMRGFMRLVKPDVPPIPEYMRDIVNTVAEKIGKGERVVFMMPRRPGRQRTIAELKQELKRMGHSELEIAQLMSRTLYRR